jgi:predicted metal-dependent hydrolase
MSQLPIRRLLIDLETPFPVRWNGGDAFSSALFNALSMSFPVGEQYFIDSVRSGLQTLPAEKQADFASEVQGFVGQEATHRRLHALFNDNLARHGCRNTVEGRAQRRIKRYAHFATALHVASTAATEHFTALLSGWILHHPEIMAGAEPRLQTLWRWHSAEEAEHRCTAFDVYQAMGGQHKERLQVFSFVTTLFLLDIGRQTVRNLWHDGSLFQWQTWKSGYRLLFGPQGMISANYAGWRAYKAVDFHPRQHDTRLAQQWLSENTAQFVVAGAKPLAA